MANVSEDVSQLSIDLLMKALEALSRWSIDAARLAYDVGKDGASALSHVAKSGASTLVGLLNYLNSQPDLEFDAKTRKAMHKLRAACEKEGSGAIKITVSKSDLSGLEKWLKKQDAQYVACTPKKKKDASADKEGKDAEDALTTIFFMEKDAKKVENAVAIQAYQKKLINVLPPEAFFLLYDKKKDISVVDGLDFYELSVFREIAKKYGLGYTEMENGTKQKDESLPGTYKVVCEKGNADKLRSIMRLVSWTMAGAAAETIKEKVKERQSITAELEKLVSDGVKDGHQILVDESANQIRVENAKYVVNAMQTNQYVKVTPKGFHLFKAGKEDKFVLKTDAEYEEMLEEALSGYPSLVTFDAIDWERHGLNKSNLRRERVLEKLSVFPPEHSLENDEDAMRKAQRKRIEMGEAFDENAWLFYKYDPDEVAPLSEVVEENYSTPSQLREEVVTLQYNQAARRSEKYRYYDVESDARTVDNIILEAKERSAGNKEYGRERDQEEKDY